MRYQHYRGSMYDYIGEGRHSETGEKFVIYQSTETKMIWIRPYDMFFEKIKVDGKVVSRFTPVS